MKWNLQSRPLYEIGPDIRDIVAAVQMLSYLRDPFANVQKQIDDFAGLADDATALFVPENPDIDEAEPVAFHPVSEFVAAFLKSRGEIVRGFGPLLIWCRMSAAPLSQSPVVADIVRQLQAIDEAGADHA